MAQDTGIYWCTAKTECGLIRDSFHIRFQPYHTLDLGTDTFNCQSQPVTIGASNSYLSYLWNNGATTASITVSQTGSYVLTVHDTCGMQKDIIDVTIQSPTPPPIVHDTTVCQFTPSPQLNVSGTNLTWYQSAATLAGSAIQPYIFTAQPGYYSLLVSQTIGKCESPRVAVNIKVKYKPDANIGDYYALCTGTDTLIGGTYPEVSYLWNTGDQSCCIQPKETGTYKLAIQNDCGTSSDTAFVEVFPCDECLFVPTAFTPNGDGKNDVFYPIVKCPVYNYYLAIFNRWGQVVFSTNNTSDRWDGGYRADKADAGVYVYVLEYNSAKTKARKSLKGNITLIR
jgi:gliding motility-associated-like protein